MTKGSNLRCVSCGRDAGYNRAVVDTLADELVGGLCLACERSSYGTDLDGTATRGSNCTFCAHDGFFAFPKWKLEQIVAGSRRGNLTVGYAVESQTARLCDSHFEAVARTHTPDVVDTADSHERRERL